MNMQHGTGIRQKIRAWLGWRRDRFDAQQQPRYEAMLRSLFRLPLHSAQLAEGLVRLERLTILHRVDASFRQKARFFYFMGCVYSECKAWAKAHDAFCLCEQHIHARDVEGQWTLHRAWICVLEALNYDQLALRSYRLFMQFSEQSGLSRGKEYAFAQQRCREILAAWEAQLSTIPVSAVNHEVAAPLLCLV